MIAHDGVGMASSAIASAAQAALKHLDVASLAKPTRFLLDKYGCSNVLNCSSQIKTRVSLQLKNQPVHFGRLIPNSKGLLDKFQVSVDSSKRLVSLAVVDLDGQAAKSIQLSGEVAVPPGGREHRVLFLTFETDSPLDDKELKHHLNEGVITGSPIAPSGISMIRLCWTSAAGIPEVVMAEMKPQYPPKVGSVMNILSKISYAWIWPLVIYRERSKVFEHPPLLFELPRDSERLRSILEGPYGLLHSVIRFQLSAFICSGLFLLLAEGCSQAVPVILGLLLNDVDIKFGLLYGSLLFLMQVLRTLFYNWNSWIIALAALRAKSALSTLIFQKALGQNSLGRQVYPFGKIMSLFAADTGKLESGILFAHSIWFIPAQVLFTSVMIYRLLGIAAFASFAVILAGIPLQAWIMSMISRNREILSNDTDARVKVFQEMLIGSRVLKFYSWEDVFLEKLAQAREKELKSIWRHHMLSGLSVVLMVLVPAFAASCGYATFVYLGNELTASVVFTALAYFNMLEIPLSNLPLVANTVVDLRAASQRIDTFLKCNFGVVSRNLGDSKADTEFAIVVSHATFQRDPFDDDAVGKRKRLRIREAPHHDTLTPRAKSKQRPSPHNSDTVPTQSSRPFYGLTDIDLQIPKGSLVAIVGPVGSGKSSLISAILGELPLSSGEVQIIPSRIGLCPQQSWIKNGTVRDNIIMDHEFDIARYTKVISQCCLESDIASFPLGDGSLLGEKGISLSGGQKARINIARVVYALPDIAILDDPLSAVDSKVVSSLFYDCIYGGMLQFCTRILVTHNLTVLPYCDIVFVMNSGTIEDIGPFDSLSKKQGSWLCESLRKYGLENLVAEDEEADEDSDELEEDDVVELDPKEQNTELIRSGSVQPFGVSHLTKTINFVPRQEKENAFHAFALYGRYFGSIGYHLFVLFALLTNEALRVAKDLWLSFWLEESITGGLSIRTKILILISLSCGLVITTYLNILAFFGGGRRAAKRLHLTATQKIFRSPVSFFDLTPCGKLLNRFTRDQDLVDNQLPDDFYFLLYTLTSLVGTIVMVSISDWHLAFVLIIPLLICLWIQYVYRIASKLAQMRYASSLGPIMSHITDSVTGARVIHSFNLSTVFISKYFSLSDSLNQSSTLLIGLRRWTSLHAELVGSVLILIVTFGCVLLRISASFSGLIIASLISFAISLDWLVKQFGDTESSLVSIERIHHYVKNLKEEPLDDGVQASENWPTLGNVEFRRLSISYKSNPRPVLRDITLHISAGEKIAVVGRTGAGKSTLLSALFRLVEPKSGTIMIDGCDILTLSLRSLRTKLTVVPQEPILFAGSLRFNLDPSSKFSNDDLLVAIEAVGLDLKMLSGKGLHSPLEFNVADGGENLSIGQRQLVCMARAFLHRSQVVILDEPTANMDMATDELVQTRLWDIFSDCTVFTITHRLTYISDYDRVLVLDHGEVAEFDRPEVLLAEEGSILFSMVKEADS